MATIIAQLDRIFRTAISEALQIDADPQIGVSQNPNFGDYQSNAAMGLAKTLSESSGTKTNPRAVAEKIKAKLQLGDIAQEISIAGPGFINIRLSSTWLSGRMDELLKEPRLGIDPAEKKQTIVVDYSGPNIAKEMHVGHLRSTIIGDAIVRVLEKFDHKVIRQNHVGDWGTQFGMLIEHMLGTFGAERILNKNSDISISDLNVFYQDAKGVFDTNPQFAERARNRVVSLQRGDSESREAWKQLTIQSLHHFDETYDRLGVKLLDTDLRGESAYNADLTHVVFDLIATKVAVESQGARVVQVPDFEAPFIIQKSDGGYLYGTTDLAAIRYRVYTLHANRIIYVHDSRQAQHFKQLFWTARHAHWVDNVALDYAPFGTMLGEDNKPFKTRTGGTVKLKELLDEAEEHAMKVVTEKNPELPEEQRKQIAHAVGIGAVKYSDLSKDRVADYVFSFDKMLSLDGNTAPYLQYAHARIRSIFRKANEKPGNITLQSPFELALAKQILRLPEIVAIVARELKPHHLCTYLYDLATHFSGFYENCPVIKSEQPTRGSRLALCELTAQTMASGLDLLGIEHPEQM